MLSIFVFFSSHAYAAMTLTTLADDIQVYSGPGERFRVIATLPDKTEIKAAEEIVNSRAGRFYKVLVRKGDDHRAIGFIPINAPIRIGGVDEDEDELSKYGAIALISKAAQVTFSSLKDKQTLWTVGYMHYLSPGFYAKGFGGQWTTPITDAFVAGAELGNDSLLFGSVSGFVSYGIGIFSPNAENEIFAGSKKLNILMTATLGFRYNLEGFASFGVAVIQSAIHNPNNSLLSTGAQLSLEVGL
ncbi:MAG: hypothetical protein RBT63_11315 [Bdellovibrionales bacterium]|nr:hypothetical protein [Bdellovibrionales bacterium]